MLDIGDFIVIMLSGWKRYFRSLFSTFLISPRRNPMTLTSHCSLITDVSSLLTLRPSDIKPVFACGKLRHIATRAMLHADCHNQFYGSRWLPSGP